MGGNIGVPALALEPFAPGRAYVLEVSSYQIDLAPSLQATVGMLLNVSQDHLDRHGSMENYAALKERLPASVEQGGTAVIGVDDRYTRAAADRIARAEKTVVRVSVGRRCARAITPRAAASCARPMARRKPSPSSPASAACAAQHNAQNAACAVAACVALGLNLAAIQKGWRVSPASPTACSRWQDARAKCCSSTTRKRPMPTARNALSSFHEFSGSPAANQDRRHRKPRRILSAHRKAYLIGEAAAEFAQTLDGKVPYEIERHAVGRRRRRRARCRSIQAKEPVVLLSPACASFDQYPNFEVRGKAFTDLVLAMPGVNRAIMRRGAGHSPARGGRSGEAQFAVEAIASPDPPPKREMTAAFAQPSLMLPKP